MAACFSILARKILWSEKPDWLQSMGSQQSDKTERTCRWPYVGNRKAYRILFSACALPTVQHRELYSTSCDKPWWERIWKKNAYVKRMEKTMAAHSSVLAWEIPWTEEPGGLQSVGSQKSQTRLSTQCMVQWRVVITFDYSPKSLYDPGLHLIYDNNQQSKK